MNATGIRLFSVCDGAAVVLRILRAGLDSEKGRSLSMSFHPSFLERSNSRTIAA